MVPISALVIHDFPGSWHQGERQRCIFHISCWLAESDPYDVGKSLVSSSTEFRKVIEDHFLPSRAWEITFLLHKGHVRMRDDASDMCQCVMY